MDTGFEGKIPKKKILFFLKINIDLLPVSMIPSIFTRKKNITCMLIYKNYNYIAQNKSTQKTIMNMSSKNNLKNDLNSYIPQLNYMQARIKELI